MDWFGLMIFRGFSGRESAASPYKRCHENLNEFACAILEFLRKDKPEKWKGIRDAASDTFGIIDPDKFRSSSCAASATIVEQFLGHIRIQPVGNAMPANPARM
jgi:hypothetical protein